jgi:hypothetical protein
MGHNPLRIRITGAPDFAPYVEELLEKACVESNSEARFSLDSHLQCAWADYRRERRHHKEGPPPELIEQLENSIRRMQQLLGRLARFPASKEVIADECPVGEGTVNIAAVKEMMLGKTLDLPRNPPSLARSVTV